MTLTPKPPRFSKIFPEWLIEETLLVQFAKLLERGLGNGEGENVRRQILAHRDISGAYHGLRNVQVLEQRNQLHASRSERGNDRRWMTRRAIILGAQHEHAELVGVNIEGDGLEIFMLIFPYHFPIKSIDWRMVVLDPRSVL